MRSERDAAKKLGETENKEQKESIEQVERFIDVGRK